ncbi:MAG: type II toxin-antitoxin system prevent-host-death family antitoxin [Candidatus Rokuibacteriota bacterium]|nr:MAG: type II toxin-antitoxin system prevent-host-death family antitoxin [Candidatus Rokubacteria bacterium]
MEETMKTMPAGEFKARCLRVMEEVKKYRTPVVITKKGKPVAKLVPPDEPRKDVFGCMAGTIKILGDVEAPVLPPIDEWDIAGGIDWAARPEPTPRRTKTTRRKQSR